MEPAYKDWPRLTDIALPVEPDTFLKCQLCGKDHSDICELRMWIECDDNDNPELTKVLIVCKDKNSPCNKKIGLHPRLYIEQPWGRGLPGQFMLLCGSCPYRKGFTCTHPNLKANGGEGLEAKRANPPYQIFFCGTMGCKTEHDLFPTPMIECEGNPDGRRNGKY